MKTIIALKGRHDTGKSNTIRSLYSLLVQNNYTIINSSYKEEGVDFAATFSKNNKLIGITSWGDTYEIVKTRLQKFVDDNCYICVCACRTFDRVPPGTNAAVKEFTSYKPEFIDKTVDNNESSQHRTNTADARKLFAIIENLI